MLHTYLENLRAKRPIIHCITNYVSAGDCANLLLAAGASPIMAEDPSEIQPVSAFASGCTINLGTMTEGRAKAIPLASAAYALKPIVLDPVGIGFSALRRELAESLVGQGCLSAIRGNASEIHTLSGGSDTARGVDTGAAFSMKIAVADARKLARNAQCLVVLSGKTDVITDGRTAYTVEGGHAMMSRITGCGCMFSALLAAFLAANPEEPMMAAVAASAAMKTAGASAAASVPGTGSFHTGLMDAISRMSGYLLDQEAHYEIY